MPQAAHATKAVRAVVQERCDARIARIKSQMMSRRHAAALVQQLEATGRELDSLVTRIDAAQTQTCSVLCRKRSVDMGMPPLTRGGGARVQVVAALERFR